MNATRLRQIVEPALRLQVTGPAPTTTLEAFARSLCGAAPWLERTGDPLAEVARDGLDRLTRAPLPGHQQHLVEAALMVLGILRAPTQLWRKLDERVRGQVIKALAPARLITPAPTNWVMFPAMIEAFLCWAGEPGWREGPIERALTSLDKWYLGDGVYGDGPRHCANGYNSFVMHPLALAVLDHVGPLGEPYRAKMLARAQRHAVVLARQVAPDGSFPAVGRSLTYRCGAYHLLAQLALDDRLPPEISPAQARHALAAVIGRTLDHPDTFDERGWLRPGLVGHQPGLAEPYINTGSLYFCTTAFLPLGLPPAAPFWASAPEPAPGAQIWAGADVPADDSMERRGVGVRCGSCVPG